jgi:branched-chain amino acid aminotransferase
MNTIQEYAYLNGTILPIEQAVLHVTDLGLLRGYGIFDFFRAINGKPIYLEDHLDRFEQSLAAMHLEMPYPRAALRASILQLIELNAHPLLGIKLVCTGGYSHDGYTPTTPNLYMLAKPFTIQPPTVGVQLMLVEHLRDFYEAKTTNYVKPIHVLKATKEGGFDDVLYHHEGKILESSRSNLFIIQGDTLVTPKEKVLYGITRAHTIRLAASFLTVEERDITIAEMMMADEVFITASTRRVAPVTRINDKTFEIGEKTLRLYELLLANE